MRANGGRGDSAGANPQRSRFAVGSLVLAVALLAAGGALALVAIRGPAEPTTMSERVRSVAVSLRCPVCQNLSVADSPSRLAQEMRRTIADDLRAGKTPEEIRRDFVDAYGPWILESPPKRGIDLVAWIAPALLLIAGLAAAGVAVRRWSPSGPRPPARGEERDPVPALAPGDRLLLDRALARTPEDLE